MIVDEARSWIGTPYRHQASLKGVGADCLGLVGGVAVARGIPGARDWAADPDAKGYGRRPDARALVAGCQKYLDPVPIDQAAPGDVLLLKFDGEPRHFAIVSGVEPLTIIHAYAAARRVCENSIDGEFQNGVSWRSLIVSAWRFRAK